MMKGRAAFRSDLPPIPVSRGTSYRDAFGNSVHQFNILPEHQRLKIEAESVVLVHEAAGATEDPGTLADFESRKAQLGEEYFDFWRPRAMCRGLTIFARSWKRPNKPAAAQWLDLRRPRRTSFTSFSVREGRDSRAFVD